MKFHRDFLRVAWRLKMLLSQLRVGLGYYCVQPPHQPSTTTRFRPEQRRQKDPGRGEEPTRQSGGISLCSYGGTERRSGDRVHALCKIRQDVAEERVLVRQILRVRSVGLQAVGAVLVEEDFPGFQHYVPAFHNSCGGGTQGVHEA